MDIGKDEKRVQWDNIWFQHNQTLKTDDIQKYFDDQGSSSETVKNEYSFHTKVKNEGYRLFGIFSLLLDIEGAEFRDLRNKLTHRKLSVQLVGALSNGNGSITEDKLHNQAVQLLKFTKYAIIYLINFVNTKEQDKKDGG